MRRLFIAVSFICVGAMLLAIAARQETNEALAFALVGASGVAAGAGFGSLFRKPFVWALIGIPVAFGIWFFLPTSR